MREVHVNLSMPQLCLVTHIQNISWNIYENFVLQAVEGGITMVQLRDKNKSRNEFKLIASRLKSLLAPSQVSLIINDHIEIAAEINAEGIHLGQSDISPIEARKILGPKKIIGLSIETFAQLELANSLTCIDYVAASAVFPSKTKLNCKTIWGLDGLNKITQKSLHPVMAIGGISDDNIDEVLKNGAQAIAIVSALHDSDDPKKYAQELRKKLKSNMEVNMYV